MLELRIWLWGCDYYVSVTPYREDDTIYLRIDKNPDNLTESDYLLNDVQEDIDFQVKEYEDLFNQVWEQIR